MMGLTLSMSCAQSLGLSLCQRMGLKYLLQLEQTLNHPEFPEAVRGFEGIKIADSYLKEEGSSGLLIGGLSKSVWNKNRTNDDLLRHKDVDVLILDDRFNLPSKFYKGVDWWVPQTRRLQINSDAGGFEGDVKWYENGHEIPLAFTINPRGDCKLIPGIYFPSTDFVIDTILTEVYAGIDYNRINVELDDEVEEAFERRLRKGLGKKIPYFLDQYIGKRILSKKELELEGLELRTIAAINTYNS
ncbi:hypothetical protein COU54_03950 [Candidatus Pacearchaeota archaeon CG10_big_fil_rev_8_21_14_0_10_31_24]|nr:MAG: hypothetical protein COU54_03950 [Candidatus Pacearchaeota archaeon CG10_big_fil_rev_8_21_14_0_10_31_24]